MVVLVVDEDGDVRAEIRECLANRQLACREAATARDALRAALGPAGIPIQLDARSGRVIAEGRRVELTPRERELLSALIAQAGRVVRRSQLIDRLQAGREPRSERGSTPTSRASAASSVR